MSDLRILNLVEMTLGVMPRDRRCLISFCWSLDGTDVLRIISSSRDLFLEIESWRLSRWVPWERCAGLTQ